MAWSKEQRNYTTVNIDKDLNRKLAIVASAKGITKWELLNTIVEDMVEATGYFDDTGNAIELD